MARLRARARADRHAYVPPLILFAVLVLLAPLGTAARPPLFVVAGVRFGEPRSRRSPVAPLEAR
ncbi:hypothetical protein [Amycolatopsis sp. KNN50.9b]|uniref:hypothetical protein n=1 Tax=Amycolatopsis sp. KNN50.9b TaxID=2018303 RepID=UPI000B8AACD9|nr:hypothetical protein [Amycolatopsis sp. KNN50.9b]OXM74844.1 hypothetical protein CF166_02310 [Amycolatopsis sp. KNN50.9b]